MSACAPVTVSSSGMPAMRKGTLDAGLHEHGGARFAQAAVDAVFLGGDDGAAFAAGAEDRLRCRAA
jgi:hypothetical protein